MTLTARGTVYLDENQFTTDPDTYEPLNWPKRMSEHPGLEGSMTIQDFGRFAKDCMMRLQSGEKQFMEQELVKTFQGLAGVKGATYVLTDWLGNSFTVFINNFHAVPTFIGSLWRYDMDLHVLGITTLIGDSYEGE